MKSAVPACCGAVPGVAFSASAASRVLGRYILRRRVLLGGSSVAAAAGSSMRCRAWRRRWRARCSARRIVAVGGGEAQAAPEAAQLLMYGPKKLYKINSCGSGGS